MAKNKKPANKKRATPATSKKALDNNHKLDDKKIDIIAEKINKINKNFETIILECQTALRTLTHSNSNITS